MESGGCRIPLISYFHPVRVEFRRYRNEVRQTDFRGHLQIYCKFCPYTLLISNANIVRGRRRAKDCTLSLEDTDPIYRIPYQGCKNSAEEKVKYPVGGNPALNQERHQYYRYNGGVALYIRYQSHNILICYIVTDRLSDAKIHHFF